MLLQVLAFYMFAAVMIGSAAMVITARNPVHSVLYLILAFFNAAGLFVLIGAEFVAMILVIVYVGAVAVLFLFVVMMLDINIQTRMRQGIKKYLPVALIIGGILLVQLIVVIGAIQVPAAEQIALPIPDATQVTNTRALGNVLYTQYAFAFQMAGLVLLVAMIGAIVLTHRSRPGVRRQKIDAQLARKPADVLVIKSVQSGSGGIS